MNHMCMRWLLSTLSAFEQSGQDKELDGGQSSIQSHAQSGAHLPRLDDVLANQLLRHPFSPETTAWLNSNRASQAGVILCVHSNLRAA